VEIIGKHRRIEFDCFGRGREKTSFQKQIAENLSSRREAFAQRIKIV